MTQTFHDEILFGFSNFGHWELFDICNFNNSMNFQQSKSPLGIKQSLVLWARILYIPHPINYWKTYAVQVGSRKLQGDRSR
jgi:hypothetical protein